MAKIKQGILGGFSGKVANVVGTSWKGRAVMKSQPLSVANPRTTAQVEQRNKFSYIAELASSILTQFVQPVENPISGDISGYNLFCKDNKNAFNSVGQLSAANLNAGGGQLPNVTNVSIDEINATGSSVTLSFDENTNVPLRLTDIVYAIVMTDDAANIWASIGTDKRSDTNVECFRVKGDNIPSTGTSVIVLYACVSADGRSVSVKTNGVNLVVA